MKKLGVCLYVAFMSDLSLAVVDRCKEIAIEAQFYSSETGHKSPQSHSYRGTISDTKKLKSKTSGHLAFGDRMFGKKVFSWELDPTYGFYMLKKDLVTLLKGDALGMSEDERNALRYFEEQLAFEENDIYIELDVESFSPPYRGSVQVEIRGSVQVEIQSLDYLKYDMIDMNFTYEKCR